MKMCWELEVSTLLQLRGIGSRTMELIGVRDVGSTSKSELKPGEKSPYKIPDIGKSYPNTDFNVTAEGTDYTNMVEVSGDEMIRD